MNFPQPIPSKWLAWSDIKIMNNSLISRRNRKIPGRRERPKHLVMIIKGHSWQRCSNWINNVPGKEMLHTWKLPRAIWKLDIPQAQVQQLLIICTRREELTQRFWCDPSSLPGQIRLKAWLPSYFFFKKWMDIQNDLPCWRITRPTLCSPEICSRQIF